MKEEGLRSKVKKKFKATTDSRHKLPVAENLLSRNFSPIDENIAWASDITYVWTNEGWLYLCIILDLFSRRVVGWSMDNNLRAELVLDALKMAVRARNPKPGLIFHSDRGVQYASDVVRNSIKALGFMRSMSRKGNCWDNAVAESFFRSLKTELTHHEKFETRSEAMVAVFDYIEAFYNRVRRHSTLGYLSPVVYEQLARVS